MRRLKMFVLLLLLLFTARRNEEITCDEILLALSKLRKLNGIFQEEIARSYFSIVNTNNSAFNDCGFFHQIYMPHRSEWPYNPIY